MERLVYSCRCPHHHPVFDRLVAHAAGANRTVPLAAAAGDPIRTQQCRDARPGASPAGSQPQGL